MEHTSTMEQPAWRGYEWDSTGLPLSITQQGATLDLLKVLDTGRKNYADGITVRCDSHMPANKAYFYFEVTVDARGQDGTVAVGMTTAQISFQGMPGSHTGSYGYHGSDGSKFSSGERWAYGPPFGKGDTVGLCVDRARQTFFFTRNGTRLGQAVLNDKEEWYPAVGLYKGGDRVTVNFGRQDFKFDIANYEWELKQHIKTQVNAVPLDHGVSRRAAVELIKTYLVHQGYTETTRLFCETLHDRSLDRSYNEEHMQIRQEIRSLLVAGQVDEAVERTHSTFPQVLQQNEKLAFRLECFRFIAMIAGKRAWEDVVSFGKRLQALFDDSEGLSNDSELRELLRQAFSLVAYADPADSPTKWLLESDQRIALASALNESILVHCQSNPKSGLEVLFRHLMVTRDKMLASNVSSASLIT